MKIIVLANQYISSFFIQICKTTKMSFATGTKSFVRLVSLRFPNIHIIPSQSISTLRSRIQGIRLIENTCTSNYNKYILPSPQLHIKKSFATTVIVTSEALPKKGKPSISVLGKLRKQTGYSLSLCKKALVNCNQDVEEAKKWLDEQAQTEGWSKANKLEGRNTTQGLIGVCLSSDERAAAVVELNSETDFVARNKQFHGLLKQIISTILNNTHSEHSQNDGSILIEQKLNKENLSNIPVTGSQDKTLADLVALNIGQIGENIVLRRAATFSIDMTGYRKRREDVRLAVVTHPSAHPAADSSNVAYGRFGVIMAYSKEKKVGIIPEGQTVASMARQLCQHIIGMNPTSVGNLDDPSTWPVRNKDIKDVEYKSEKGEGVKEDEDWEHVGEAKGEESSRKELIHQAFLLDSDIVVRDLLLQSGMKIKSFIRFELGEE